MLVFIAAATAFLITLMLSELGGDLNVYAKFSVIACAHVVVGFASWKGHFHTWGNRALWLLGINIFAAQFTLHWSLYAGLIFPADPDTQGIGQMLVLTVLVLVPGIMVVGGPLVSLVTRRRSIHG